MKFVELNHITANSKITAFLDTIATDKEILDQIIKKLNIDHEENLPRKEG